ncbi:hypothetical protein BDV12DRAFT_205026 [Aspergillus spectabilis]
MGFKPLINTSFPRSQIPLQQLSDGDANDYTLDELEEIYVDLDVGPVANTCPQTLDITGALDMTCQEASMYFNISTAGLMNLNNALDCRRLANATLCALLSCPIIVIKIESNNIHVDQWVDRYTSFSLTQFYTWNPYIGLPMMARGDSVCSGSPNLIPETPLTIQPSGWCLYTPFGNSAYHNHITSNLYVDIIKCRHKVLCLAS